MAQLVLNGGERKNKLRITAEQPQEVVVAYKRLERINRELRRFQQEFASTPETVEKVEERAIDSDLLMRAYLEALDSCARSLKKEIKEMPEEKRNYYLPVMQFLSRASNAHTILPFGKYLTIYLNDLRMTASNDIHLIQDEMPYIGGISSMRGFIEGRIAESIKTCEAYCALLSNSLGSYTRFFSLEEMVTTIAVVQKEVSIHSIGGMFLRTKSMSKVRDQHNSGVHLDLRPVGEVLGIPALAYFLIHQIVSNAFKASFRIAAHQQKYDSNSLPEGYANLPTIKKPRVDISLTRESTEFVKLIISDNGMGVPQGELGRLFGDPSQRLSVFTHIVASNRSSTALFPFMADLIGVDMTFTSDGVGKGFSAELLFPVDLAMRSAKFARNE